MGGTIAYTWKNGVPQIGDLTGFIDSLDEVKKEADITVKAFRQKSSSSMVISDITGLAAEIQSLLEGETEGVVVVQGTDTIEETAFALEMLLDSEKPVAVTGAMRNPDMRVQGNDRRVEPDQELPGERRTADHDPRRGRMQSGQHQRRSGFNETSGIH